MKKNKTVAFMLAASLMVGGTFLGTKALFTDKIDTVGELKISTGDVDIEVVENAENTPKGWQLDRNGNEIKDRTTVDGDTGTDGILLDGGDDIDESSTPFANNLKPGDVLTKIVTVKNVGTLNAKLELSQDNIADKLGVLNGLITPTETKVKIADDNNDKLLSPGETATFTLKLTVDNKGGEHNKGGFNTDEIENTVVDLTNAWVLTATQQNPDKIGQTPQQ